MRADSATADLFRTEGVVCLRGIFRDWVPVLEQGIAAVLAQPSSRERSYRPQDGSAGFFQDYCNWERVPPLRRFVLESGAAELAAHLMGASLARFFHDHVLVKHPGSSTVTPWHQDEPYYCVSGEQSVSFWTPIDPVAREVTLECVAGSHRWSEAGFRPRRFDGTPLYAEDAFEDVPDIDAQRSQLPIRAWAMEPGDAVAFDFRIVHGAPANPSTRPRRVFSHRWVGERARFLRRAGRTSPDFPELSLADGAPFEAPQFPVVWRA